MICVRGLQFQPSFSASGQVFIVASSRPTTSALEARIALATWSSVSGHPAGSLQN
jgi:hypothetical protein